MALDTANNFDTIAQLRKMLCDLIVARQDVIAIATAGRSKFEPWLKFELAAILANAVGFSDVTVEPEYGLAAEQADLAFVANGVRWYAELKTPNTSWRANGVENKSKNTTDNFSAVETDVVRLRRNCPPNKGVLVFVVFPVPERIWTQESYRLQKYLERVEELCRMNEGDLMRSTTLIKSTPEVGVVPFVAVAI